jgi:endonuclease/exonuclease/phosphatase (EEP) superfamily protein YafD
MPAARLDWAVAAGAAGWALARLAAADRLPKADAPAVAALAFTPQVAAGAWLAALLMRDERAAAATAMAAGAMTAVLAQRATASPQPAATGPELRVLSVNLLAGRAQPGPVTSLVRGMGADVLFAQELTASADMRLRRAGLSDLLPYSVSDAGTPASRGNAIYSRYPLSDCPSVPATPWAQPTATVQLPSSVARLVCVHLLTPKQPWVRSTVSDWAGELRALSAIELGDPPVIVAGDFNATLDHVAFRGLLRHGLADAASQSGSGLAPTWGIRPWGLRALLTIDHVLTDPRCAVLGTSVHRLPGTDHRGVLARVRLPS